MPDKYEIHAQYVPTILYSASFAVISFYYLSQIKTDFWGTVLTLGVGGISMTFALYQLAKHMSRFVGVKLQEWIFRDGQNLPTTRFLLDNDTTYSAERKAEIVSKIKNEFGFNLSANTTDSFTNRRRIHEVVGQVRKRYIKREMVLQRNIQYGFWRNLMGGALIALPVSVVAVTLGYVTRLKTGLVMASLFLLAYFVTGIVSFFAMKLCAKYYALALYDELLS